MGGVEGAGWEGGGLGAVMGPGGGTEDPETGRKF